MQPWNHILRVGVAGLLLAALTAGGWAAEDKKDEPKQARHDLGWWEHYRASEKTPEAQLTWANELKDAGHTIRASKACLALVNSWPESSQAPVAQLMYCRLLEQRGKPAKAFEEYQFLVEAYAGFFPYDEVMDRMYAIADGLATRDRYFLFVIKFKTPEEAIPLFEKLIRNGTQWKRAAELQFRIARIYEKAQQYDLAIEAYGAYHQRYPMSPLAEQALFGQGRCCYAYSRENPVALDLRENAVAVLQGFLDWYPYSAMAGEARACLAELQRDLAGGLYGQAALYEKTARFSGDKRERRNSLTAARICYERVIDEFPHSVWAEQAHVRIAEIKRQGGGA
ncbi:MAG: tetratricopeptide repeat protein [Kiritimatiellia bacterium]|jgi:outer membrane protein assembly factor BamD (BamD/ComL family)